MKNANQWKLAAILGGLVLVFVVIKTFRSPMLEGNLPASIASIDTAAVTELIITPGKARAEKVRMVRTGGWKLMRDNQVLRLDQGAGANALRMLTELKPERMVTKRKEKWDEFGVGDSTGTWVRVMAGGSTEAELIIGRSGFGQIAGQGYGGSPFTYVRSADDPEVFTVAGFLDAQFNRTTDEWRDKSFLRLRRDSVTRISFRYPADSSYVVEKRQGRWMLNANPADSAAVIGYLGSMEYRNVQTFASIPPAGSPAMVVTFEKNGRTQATVDAWPVGDRWTLRSSHQPETYFDVEAATVRDILSGSKRFAPKP